MIEIIKQCNNDRKYLILNIVDSDEFKLKFNGKNTSKQCGSCNNPNSKLKCSKCKLIYYCNRECQVKHWKEHKLICKKN